MLIPGDGHIVHNGDAAVSGDDVFYTGQFFFSQVIEERNHHVIGLLINDVSEINGDGTVACGMEMIGRRQDVLV